MPPVDEHAARKIAARLLPFLFLIYIVALLDKVNVSFAGLDIVSSGNLALALP